MTADELRKMGALYFETIKEGLAIYENEMVPMDAEAAEHHFCCLRERNGASKSYADFYYYRLSAAEQQRVEAVLTEAEVVYLHDNRPDSAVDIVFPLEDMLLKIIAKLNETEMLFSTLYFLHDKTTWWGNYNQEYIVFWEKET